MKIPQSFKTAIKNTFYDKLITTYIIIDHVDEDDGWSSESEAVANSSFYGNVKFENFAYIQEKYGLKDDFRISITTDEAITLKTVISHQGNYYQVKNVLETDSHYLLLCDEWSSRSSTSISV